MVAVAVATTMASAVAAAAATTHTHSASANIRKHYAQEMVRNKFCVQTMWIIRHNVDLVYFTAFVSPISFSFSFWIFRPTITQTHFELSRVCVVHIFEANMIYRPIDMINNWTFFSFVLLFCDFAGILCSFFLFYFCWCLLSMCQCRFGFTRTYYIFSVFAHRRRRHHRFWNRQYLHMIS